MRGEGGQSGIRNSTNAEEVTAMKEYLASCSVELLQHQEAIDSELR